MSFKNHRKRYQAIVLLLGLFCSVMLFWKIGLRTTSPRVNWLLVGVAFVLPLVCLILGRAEFSIGGRNNRFKLFSLLIVSIFSTILFLGWLFAALYFGVLTENKDHSRELLRMEKIGKEELSVYLTNGGAMTGYGIVIRKEIKLIPGIFLVRNVDGKHPAHDVKISVGPEGKLQYHYYGL